MTESIEQYTQEIAQQLTARQWKLVTAESCTGGGLSYYLTEIPGSSHWFDHGYVTYSNTSKEALLKVNPLTLSVFGSVSEQTAREMAEGALKHSEAHISIAVTGIAGPTGGTPDKPVGTIWLSIASKHANTSAVVDIFSGNRKEVRQQTIQTALKHLLEFITEKTHLGPANK